MESMMRQNYPNDAVVLMVSTWSFSVLGMVNFSDTINYLATQMNNEISFKQHNNESFIIVAGCKGVRVRKCPFCVASLYVDPWFVGSVFFSDRVPSGISSSGCERCLFELPANSSLTGDTLPKKELEKIVLERKKESMRSARIVQLSGRIAWQGKGNRSVAATVSHFQVFLSFYQFFGDCSKYSNCNWYYHHLHGP